MSNDDIETQKAIASGGRPKKIKSKAKRNAERPRKTIKVDKSELKGELWNFPRHSIDDALKIPLIIEEKNAGKPIDAATLASWLGYKKSSDWRFLRLLKSANQYGLVDGSGEKAKVSITDLGNDIVAPSDPSQRQRALLKSFSSVELFSGVAEYYKGKKIPEDEYFSNTLIREFNVHRDRVTTFIKVFTQSATYLKSFQPDAFITGPLPVSKDGNGKPDSGDEDIKTAKEGVREFLGTCFILMPFGEWYDKYYKELYTGAIKDAGLEPVRADDLFITGMVIEQIWEQINKSKMLLAELSGKNPNVFYELGLAHALSKPVIFITENLEDVPFDLRHLRIITYDKREPNWGNKLKSHITDYLKKAKAEPERCIPPTFRINAEEEGE